MHGQFQDFGKLRRDAGRIVMLVTCLGDLPLFNGVCAKRHDGLHVGSFDVKMGKCGVTIIDITVCYCR
jgi:hypothetical protein